MSWRIVFLGQHVNRQIQYLRQHWFGRNQIKKFIHHQNTVDLIILQCWLKNKLDHNLAHDFSQTTRDTDYFASNILTVEFFSIYSV